MIELIHRYPILIKALLALVTITFIGTGGWILNAEKKSEFAAMVGDRKVTIQEYQEAVARTEDLYRKIYQGNLTDDMMKKLEPNKRAIEALVDKQLILLAAEKEGISVSTDELEKMVWDNPSFKGKDGRFSKDRYVQLLKDNGMSPGQYERSLREEMTIEKFRKLVKGSVYVTEAEVRDFYAAQMKAQNKPFSEEDFKSKIAELTRSYMLVAQDKTMNSFMEGLKKNFKVEINPDILKQS